MEVFEMNKYDGMYEVKKAIEAYSGANSSCEKRFGSRRSKNRQWDYIIRTVCTGCGKTLGQYENLNGFAFCFDCRKILFPETIVGHEPLGKRFP
jgi:hypothetical protein